MAEDVNTLTAEIWKDIPGWVGFYQASSLGRIRSVPRTKKHKSKKGLWFEMPIKGRVLKQRLNGKGYCMVQLSNMRESETTKVRRVNRLVCMAFHGLPPCEGLEAAHNDGCRTNNTPANLRWATRLDNMADVVIHRAARLAIGG